MQNRDGCFDTTQNSEVRKISSRIRPRTRHAAGTIRFAFVIASLIVAAATAVTTAFADNDSVVEGGAIGSARIDTAHSVGAELFEIPIPGERFAPLKGTISHVTTDLSLEGDGLLRFGVTRRHEPSPAAYPYAFGTMSLDVPTLRYRINTADGRSRAASDNTCTNLTNVTASSGATATWMSNPNWAALELFDAVTFSYGDISTKLLPMNMINEPQRGNYPAGIVAASKENYLFTCDGDTFVISAPDGTEYRFNGARDSEIVRTIEESENLQGDDPVKYYFYQYTIKGSAIQRLNASVELTPTVSVS